MADNGGQTPVYRVLTEGKKQEIYLAAQEVLRRTGMRVLMPEARELFREAGCWIESERVRIPAHLVEWAVRVAPRRILVGDREGKPAMFLEAGRSYYGTGGDCPTVLDARTGERRPGRLQDVVDFSRMVDALPNIDFLINMAIAQELPQQVSDLYHFEAMLNNTTKPILYSAWNLAHVKVIVEMCEMVAGSAEAFQRTPFAVYFGAEPSPLQITQEFAPTLMYLASKGLPVVFSPTDAGGGTAPVTLAGAIAQNQAEMLANLLLAQLTREGSPFIMSTCGPNPLDMSAMTASYASPEFQLLTCAMAEMARFHGLPVFSYGGCADSKCFDEQASLEGGMSMLLSALSGGNLIHDVGYVESGLTSSYDMLVAMDEVAGFVKRVLSGIEVDPDALALDVINQVGPGGEYVTHTHTYRHFRENWAPKLLDRNNYSTWKERGGLTLRDRVHRKVLSILDSHESKPLGTLVKAKVSEIMARESEQCAGTGST
jgi:trimethylamine--corrinoid protein Co-methyltransferase